MMYSLGFDERMWKSRRSDGHRGLEGDVGGARVTLNPRLSTCLFLSFSLSLLFDLFVARVSIRPGPGTSNIGRRMNFAFRSRHSPRTSENEDEEDDDAGGLCLRLERLR